METYAILETGGKQYRVEKGQVLDVERLSGEVGASITLDKVLALSDGKELKVGAPAIAGAAVKAEVVEHKRGPKKIAFKKRRRKASKKKIGHRQELTRIKITDLS